jgi:multisubunit Na+/H+ antiporter MnhB subunit
VTTIHLPFGQELHFASAAVFDIGVFLVVVGVAVGMIQRLSEELE